MMSRQLKVTPGSKQWKLLDEEGRLLYKGDRKLDVVDVAIRKARSDYPGKVIIHKSDGSIQCRT